MKGALEVCRAICGEAGFDLEIIDATTMEAAIRRRMLAAGIADEREYSSHLSAASAEQQELLEEFLVRESWFFRDQVPFQLLGDFVRERRSLSGAERPFSVLSAPCAGGEEPYSIAIALAEAGLAPADYRIDAVDLSRRGLEAARLARYGRNAVRHVPEAIFPKFFHSRDKDHVELKASIREAVRLHWGNLLDFPATLRSQRYDVIFCRNALIYLDAAARGRLLSQLEEMLASGGLLVVGHAESGLMFASVWQPVGGPGAFAFERRRSLATAPSHKLPAPIPFTPKSVSGSKPVVSPPVVKDRPTAESKALQIDEIRALADAGAYAEAAVQAEKLIGLQPAYADAHYLFGLIRAAEGRSTEARRAFERAAYLDPQHEPALRHLALLLEAAGERDAASRLQRRAERVGGATR